jgi:hypothetical protein
MHFTKTYRRNKRYRRCGLPVTACNRRRFPGTTQKFTRRAHPGCPLAALADSGAPDTLPMNSSNA